jgi:predicted metal-dependent phosphoesterase TrpH
MRFDLHVHTTLSPCSTLDVGEILAHARKRRLDGVCITDHDTMEIRHALREGVQPDGLCVIIGVEYSTPQGDFLLFGPFETLPPDLEANELLQTVNRRGGAAIAAHPFRAARPTDEEIVRKGLCRTVEGINGRNRDLENRQVGEWRARYCLNECGGSDAHTLEELGRVVTSFRGAVRSREELVRALNGGGFRPEWNSRLAGRPFSPAHLPATAPF